jgi:Zn finger protein HypA/HybF involved in hydrogenase expression
MASAGIKIKYIAPCGMNCGICIGHLREKNRCPGCNSPEVNIPHCISCSIKNCEHLKSSGGKFCFSCDKYPCTRLKNLDKRYRLKYGMSMLNNLNFIKISGIRNFIKEEKYRWQCSSCKKLFSAHRDNCPVCGNKKPASLRRFVELNG